VFTVKNNQRALRNLLKVLPWNEIPVSSSIGGRDHGWRERRTIKATEVADGLSFPHAVQVLQVRRTVTRGGRQSAEVVYLVTSMPMASAAPLQVAAWVRGHWAIAIRLHWVRDVTFDEDRSAVRTGTGPQVMATIRNTIVSVIRLAGHDNIAAPLRHRSRNPHRRVDLLHAA